MILMERNKYILSSLGIALNKIMNNKTFYELYNNNENLSNIFGQIFQSGSILLPFNILSQNCE